MRGLDWMALMLAVGIALYTIVGDVGSEQLFRMCVLVGLAILVAETVHPSKRLP